MLGKTQSSLYKLYNHEKITQTTKITESTVIISNSPHPKI